MALNSPVPGTPTPASGPQGRRDTIGIKRELERELGDFFDLYWRTFSAFMTGRLTKKGFDEAIGPVLSFRQRKLHNQLVFAIHHNAQRHSPAPTLKRREHPTGEPDSKRRHGAGDLRIEVKKDAYGNPITVTLTPAAALVRAAPRYHDTQYAVPPIETPDTFAIPPTSLQARDIPSRELLRQRIQYVAQREAVPIAVSDRAAEMAEIGLQTYLQNIVSAALRKTRPSAGAGYGPPISELSFGQAHSPDENGPVLLNGGPSKKTGAEKPRGRPGRPPAPSLSMQAATPPAEGQPPPVSEPTIISPSRTMSPNRAQPRSSGSRARSASPGLSERSVSPDAQETRRRRNPPRISVRDLHHVLRTRPSLIKGDGGEVLERCIVELGVGEGEEALVVRDPRTRL